MLVKKVCFNNLLEEFEKFGREDQFSYEGKKALFEYLNELAEALGEPIEVDIIGLCCEFTEYDSLEEFNHDYQLDLDDIDDINYYTMVIKIDEERFIIQDF